MIVKIVARLRQPILADTLAPKEVADLEVHKTLLAIVTVISVT